VPGTDLAPALGRSSNLKRIELLGRPSRMGTPAWSALTLAIAVGLAAVTASMAPPVRANVDDEARIAWSSAYGYAAPGGGLGTWTPVRADERPTNSD
jgi:hypothetical protein